MNNFKQRIDKLEKFNGKGGYSHVRLVSSDEEASAVYAVTFPPKSPPLQT